MFSKKPKKESNEHNIEKRKEPRIEKNFVLTYFKKAIPNEKFEVTQLKNISRGGVCFITTRAFEPATEMGLEMQTPYLAESVYLSGVVLASHEKATNLLYETRLQFTNLSPESEIILDKLIAFFKNKEGSKNE